MELIGRQSVGWSFLRIKRIKLYFIFLKHFGIGNIPRFGEKRVRQSCQIYFQTKIPSLGKFWMVLKCKVLVCLMALWSVLRPFGILGHLVYFEFVCYIFYHFGILHKEKSGSIDVRTCLRKPILSHKF
jgi:hypothetical protein